MEDSVVWHESVGFDGTLPVYFSYSKHSGMKMNENGYPITAYLVQNTVYEIVEQHVFRCPQSTFILQSETCCYSSTLRIVGSKDTRITIVNCRSHVQNLL